MDPRTPIPFVPRPDTGGASADYVLAQSRKPGAQAEHAVAEQDDDEDDTPDHGPALFALVIIAIVIGIGLLSLAILGAAS
jgi:multisubunit Na+/H+ antiporter MnhC subunit